MSTKIASDPVIETYFETIETIVYIEYWKDTHFDALNRKQKLKPNLKRNFEKGCVFLRTFINYFIDQAYQKLFKLT